MSATITQLIGGSFQDAEGNLLANGYLTFKLSQDGSVAGVGNICSGIELKIQLDSMGNVASSTSTPPASNQYLWANPNISPINTFYKVVGYTAEGQRAFGSNNQQVASGSVFNLDSWVPNSVISWFPSVQTTTFSVNGAPASSQSDINLEAGSNITLTDEGDGNIQISATGGGGLSGNGAGFFGTGITDLMLSVLGSSWSLTCAINEYNETFIPSQTVVVALFQLTQSFTISKCTQISDNNNTGFTSAFGVYSYGGNLLANGGSFDPSVTLGVQTNTFTPITLPAGTYWLAYSTNAPTATVSVQFVGMQIEFVGSIKLMTANSTRFAYAANLSSSGSNDPQGNPTVVLPPTLGTLTPFVPAFDDSIPMPFWE
jgi:hypothetical protein